MKVLNPTLYAFLKRQYGRVRVSNQGMRYRASRTQTERPIESGEEYVVCCPKCGDRRFRLSVNHMFGETANGTQLWHLVNCFNENCMVAPEMRDRYEDYLAWMVDDSTARPTASYACDTWSLDDVLAECRKNLALVGGVTRVDALAADHPAVLYLRGRGYDAQELGRRYAVGYCHNTDYRWRLAHRRLIIPVLYKGEYVGWQARAIPGVSKLTQNERKASSAWPYNEPKYWTSPGTRKSYFLYNYDQAALEKTGVIVEGVTDAWRVGPSGVAILGCRLSPYQAQLAATAWGGGTGHIILIGDPGFREDWEANRRRMAELVPDPSRVHLFVPEERDPGDMTHEEIWEMIYG